VERRSTGRLDSGYKTSSTEGGSIRKVGLDKFVIVHGFRIVDMKVPPREMQPPFARGFGLGDLLMRQVALF